MGKALPYKKWNEGDGPLLTVWKSEVECMETVCNDGK